MEAELTLNHSSMDFSNLLNSTKESMIEKGTFKWTSDEIARLIQIIVRPIFLTVGTTGNGLTFYIMRRTSLKNVLSCFYMSILALADTSKYTFFFKMN